MKSSVTTSILTVMLVFAFVTSTSAQNATYSISKGLKPFDEVRVIADTEVFIVKSNRNHIEMVGDSSVILNMPITQKNDALYLVHEGSEGSKLQKVVIEYKGINRLVTGGNGTIHIQGLDEKDLDVFNNNAKLTMKGRSENVKIYSQDGENDISDLLALKVTAYIGENAKLQKPSRY